MKIQALAKKSATARELALKLERKIQPVHQAAEAAKHKAHQTKIKLKQTKREAKLAKQSAKQARHALAEAQRAFQEAATQAAALEKKLLKARQKAQKAQKARKAQSSKGGSVRKAAAKARAAARPASRSATLIQPDGADVTASVATPNGPASAAPAVPPAGDNSN